VSGARLRVLEPGPLLLVEDAGRHGRLALGVSPAGYADATAARRANRLVGNPEDAAVLESLMGGVVLEVVGAAVILAVSGVVTVVESVGPDGRRLGRTAGAEAPISVPAGAVVRIAAPSAGLRAMIAVRGGVAVSPVLGSRSRDTLAGLGPAPLAVGDVVPVGAAAVGWPELDLAVVAPPPSAERELALPMRWGPRDDRLTEAGRAALLAPRVVSARGDRVGVRLDGPATVTTASPLPSEPTLAGAVEVPPDGVPIVLGRDHPTTVGYPVVAVVAPAGHDRLAQARPGTPVRLVPNR